MSKQLKSGSNQMALSRNELVVKFRDMLEKNRATLFDAAPKCVDRSYLMQMTRRTISENDDLLRCTWPSLARSISDAATLGLSLGKGITANAYIVPFLDRKKGITEAQLIVSYKGMIDLARRSGQLAHIAYNVVRAGDHFSYSLGLKAECEHRPSTDPDRGKREITHIYCAARFVNGGSFVVVKTRSEIEEHRDKYAKGLDRSDSPWRTHFEVMAIKTVVREAFNRRYLPMGVEDFRLVSSSIAREEVIESSGSTTLIEYPDIEEPEDIIDAEATTATVTDPDAETKR